MSAVASVAVIVRTEVYDVPAFHAECRTCGWRSQPFDAELSAQRANLRHAHSKHDAADAAPISLGAPVSGRAAVAGGAP
jgi:hypothetical protein